MRLPLGAAKGSEERNSGAEKCGLSRRQPERGSRAFWDAKELDREVTGGWRTCITSEPLFPRETRVRKLSRGEDHVRGGWQSGGRREAHLDTLLSRELHDRRTGDLCDSSPARAAVRDPDGADGAAH